jgi:hypothetical protein
VTSCQDRSGMREGEQSLDRAFLPCAVQHYTDRKEQPSKCNRRRKERHALKAVLRKLLRDQGHVARLVVVDVKGRVVDVRVEHSD